MIHSVFQKRPGLSYLLLGLIFVIGVVEAALVGIGAFPDKYDWILGLLLFGTTVAWMGAAALAGVVAPVSNTAMKYAYRVLLLFPLTIVATVIGYLVLSQFYNTEPDWLYYFALPVGLILLAWTPVAGLAGALAPRDINTRAYIPLVIAPILAGIGVLALPLYSALASSRIPWLGLEFMAPILPGLYGLVTFLLFREFLSRLRLIRLLRSGLVFVPVVVATITLTILTLLALWWTSWWIMDLRALALFGVVILAPFGIVTLRARDFGVSVAALGIAMASYWVVAIVAIIVGIVAVMALMDDSSFGSFVVLILSTVLAGIILSIPVGYLISEMRHPRRNVLVASIGPGLVMMMIMCFYWFVILGKAY